MIEHTTLSDEQDRLDFARRAARAFAANKEISTYSDSTIKAKSYVAIRWGMQGHGVLVFRLDETPPKNFADAVVEENKS